MYYSELETNLRELFFENKYTFIVLASIILLVILVILIAVTVTNKNQVKKCKKEIELLKEDLSKNNELNSAYLRQFTTQLERIAKALEQEPEPYIIEKDEDKL